LLHRAEDVARWEQTDDVIQEAMVKLHRELRRDVPPSIEVFFWRTSKYIRQTLVDLARRHRFASAHQVPAAPSAAEEQSGTTPDEPQDTTHEPGSLIQWGEVHEQIDQLREEHRQMFDLLYYQELTQDEAAELLGVNRRTVIRRWQSARRELVQRVDGSLPGDV
jgi:RNA polymerase sigma-70 factor (ECF subfamily)